MRGTLVHCKHKYNMVQLLWKIVWWFLKKLNRIIIWPSNSTLWCIPERTESTNSNRYLYASVHCSIVLKSQKVETIQVALNCWMNPHNMIYTYGWNIIQLYKNNEGLIHATTWMNLWKHYGKWNKPDIKGQILYDFTYMKYLE